MEIRSRITGFPCLLETMSETDIYREINMRNACTAVTQEAIDSTKDGTYLNYLLRRMEETTREIHYLKEVIKTRNS